MRHCVAVLAVLIVAVGGCTHPLDRQAMNLRQKFHTSADVFASAMEEFVNVANEQQREKSDMHRKLIKNEWNRWLQSHTGADGRLYSSDARGNPAPMLASDIENAVTSRETEIGKLLQNDARWTTVYRATSKGIERFKATNEMVADEEVKVQEANESAQAALTNILSALGSLAAGAVSGATVIP